MVPKEKRKGGLGVDPAVSSWQQGARTNKAALSKKAKRDRQRIRVEMDLPPELKARLVECAQELETSGSQCMAFLLAWALHELHTGNAELKSELEQAKTWAKALRFNFDLEIPEDWLNDTSTED